MQTVDSLPFSVLKIIFDIVKEDAYPLTYVIKPRELILRSMLDWSVIHTALADLENEGLVVTQQKDTLQILLTSKGLQLCQQN